MTKYIRTNAWKHGGTFANEHLLWYAKGVGVMQERALNDLCSWWFFAAIHGEYVTTSGFPGWGDLPVPPPTPTTPQPTPAIEGKYWDQCQHQSWYFPPWHRGYLLALEAQIRHAVIKLGGPSEWALPYWNYFGPGDEYKIPPAFTQTTLPDGSANPLYVAARYGPNNNGVIYVPTNTAVGGPVNQTCMSNDIYTGNDAVTPPPGFGGPSTGFSHSGGSSGNLENNPHNLVHVFVGGTAPDGATWGLMSDPGLAALDPIFYLHHANIDRMWAVWNTTYGNPTDPTWLNGPASIGEREFVMPMPHRHDCHGRELVYTPSEVDSLDKVDYTYDDLHRRVPAANILANRLRALGATAAAAKVSEGAAVTRSTRMELVGASEQPLQIKGKGSTTTVRLDPAVRSKLSASLSAAAETLAPDRTFLNLENVRGTHDGTALNVYINLPQGSLPADHPELLAGSVGLFGLHRASLPDGQHAGQGLSFILEITGIVDKLHLDGQLDNDSLSVAVVPYNEVPGQAQLTVGRISVYRQGSDKDPE
ncbi:MAG: tyrosinase family protein [Terracidiphilus sp.]